MSTQGGHIFSHEPEQEVAQVSTVVVPPVTPIPSLGHKARKKGTEKWAITQDEAT